MNVLSGESKEVVASGWKDTPREEQEVSFPIPAGRDVTGVELYVMTTDGARVENRIRRIVLAGDRRRCRSRRECRTRGSAPPGSTCSGRWRSWPGPARADQRARAGGPKRGADR